MLCPHFWDPVRKFLMCEYLHCCDNGACFLNAMNAWLYDSQLLFMIQEWEGNVWAEVSWRTNNKQSQGGFWEIYHYPPVYIIKGKVTWSFALIQDFVSVWSSDKACFIIIMIHSFSVFVFNVQKVFEVSSFDLKSKLKREKFLFIYTYTHTHIYIIKPIFLENQRFQVSLTTSVQKWSQVHTGGHQLQTRNGELTALRRCGLVCVIKDKTCLWKQA